MPKECSERITYVVQAQILRNVSFLFYVFNMFKFKTSGKKQKGAIRTRHPTQRQCDGSCLATNNPRR